MKRLVTLSVFVIIILAFTFTSCDKKDEKIKDNNNKIPETIRIV